ncbi:ABC transporter permease [Labrys wisconsinensis]|uniref:Ribose/xylose/arabinose/galactoside ABC-type transport system permease subunit n=1 Tax=Labrys wisconsinensis TaxID=425677 RepID=A0ABU0J1W9_9HYPH|nr:ABC transporter permease [Labrys wisconsinensis]MDQ0468250.1 ribose/xylose/arabinose/galactoside ABC-type transport system permease subunit [Labrys wisconsinensis]
MSAAWRRLLLLNKAVLFAVVLATVLSFASPYFFTRPNTLALLEQSVVMAIVALGYTLILAMGEIDLSLGGIIALAGFVMAKLMAEAGLPYELAIPAGLAMGALCGGLNATLVSTFDLPPFIVTLATGALFTGVLYIISNLVPISDLPADFIAIGQARWAGVPLPVVIVVPIVIGFYLLASQSVFGQHVIAQGGNPEAVRVAGINIRLLRLKVYALAGACYGVGAVLLTARSASAQIAAGSDLLLVVITAVVIGGTPLLGGKANMVGTVFGCLIIGMINNGLNLLGMNANYQIVMQGLLILFALLVDVQSAKILLGLDRRRLQRLRREGRL